MDCQNTNNAGSHQSCGEYLNVIVEQYEVLTDQEQFDHLSTVNLSNDKVIWKMKQKDT